MATQAGAQDPGTPFADLSQAMVQMIMGFRITQMIYVAAKLGIADLLKDGSRDVESLAQTTGTDAPSLYRLLRALASVGIFAEDEQGSFALTPLAALLQSGVFGSQRARALFFGGSAQWRSWGEMLYSITTGKPAFREVHGMGPWEYMARDTELGAAFNGFMFANTQSQAEAALTAYDFSGFGTIVDVGGGHGALISAILQANPNLHGILCDTPHVVMDAGPLLEAAGVRDRCELVPCDFFSSVPDGGDAYILKKIVHDWDDEHALAILKTCRRAVPERGRLLILDSVIEPGNAPDPAKILDLQMLLEFAGRERTEAQFRALLDEAGFTLTKIVPADVQFSIIEAIPQ